MITISLCMIVKNEEAVLERCLECVCGIVDEIIIVDTGSSDKTKEIAPLIVPENATIIDSTNLTIDEVVDKILSFVK